MDVFVLMFDGLMFDGVRYRYLKIYDCVLIESVFVMVEKDVIGWMIVVGGWVKMGCEVE